MSRLRRSSPADAVSVSARGTVPPCYVRGTVPLPGAPGILPGRLPRFGLHRTRLRKPLAGAALVEHHHRQGQEEESNPRVEEERHEKQDDKDRGHAEGWCKISSAPSAEIPPVSGVPQ